MIKIFLKQHKMLILYSITFIIFCSILDLGQSFLLEVIIDSNSLQLLSKTIVVIVGFLALYLLINFLQVHSINVIRCKFRNHYNNFLFSYYLHLPIRENFELGYMINSFVSENQIITEKYVSSILNLLYFSVSIVFGTIYIWNINWVLGLFLYIMAILPLLINKVFARSISRRQKKALQAQSNWISWLNMFFKNRIAIAVFGYGDTMVQETVRKSNDLNDRQYALDFVFGSLKSMNSLFSKIMFLFLVVIGMYFVINKQMTIGGLIAITQASNMIIMPISNFIDVKNNLVASKEILNACKQKEVLLSAAIKEIATTSKLHEEIQKIQFKNLCISFGDNLLMDKVNVKVIQGKKYLIVGESGSGKSSLLNVLLKRIRVEDGNVFINEKDINSINYFDNIAYVPQTNALFPYTLRDNITLKTRYDEEQYGKIVNLCALHHLEDLPPFDVENITLSGGEMQRINIARMLYSNKKWILLDEAFSALDDRNQRRIQKEILVNTELTVLSIEHKILPDMIAYFDYKIEVSNQRVNITPIAHSHGFEKMKIN